METYQILSLLGLNTIISAILVACFKFAFSSIKKNAAQTDAVKLGIQALLRAQMIRDWNKYSELGYAPIYAKENFENVYQNYHALGANGVMDQIHNDFLALPTK